LIVCPNTSPLVVLARLERLDLLGDPASVTITRAVLDEVHDKADDASRRIDVFASSGPRRRTRRRTIASTSREASDRARQAS
jgi:hypothetical protein